MVHLWQQTIMQDSGRHNKLFFSFKTKFKKLNLTFNKVMSLYSFKIIDLSDEMNVSFK